MFGLNGEQIVQRARALAADHSTRCDLPADASDAALATAITTVRDLVARDRKLRRPLRDTGVRSVVDSLVTWEVVVAAVGKDAAEARWLELHGRERTADPSPVTPPTGPIPDTAVPALPAETARTVRRRRRRLPDVHVPLGLAEAVRAQPSGDADSLHRDGYEHDLWLEEWLELAVGAETFACLESAVAAHPLVDVALHEDREVLYVAAPTLNPEDVRQIVLAALADAYDPDWEQADV